MGVGQWTGRRCCGAALRSKSQSVASRLWPINLANFHIGKPLFHDVK